MIQTEEEKVKKKSIFNHQNSDSELISIKANNLRESDIMNFYARFCIRVKSIYAKHFLF